MLGGVLIGVDDVRAAVEQEMRDSGDNARSVRTREE
jgi:hypothetical protein